MVDSSSEHVAAVTVIGAGSMGHGIAQVFAMKEYDVTLVDIDQEQLTTARERIGQSLEQLGEDVPAVLERIKMTTDQTEGLSGADLMVEAVPEKIELKQELFETADRILPPMRFLRRTRARYQ